MVVAMLAAGSAVASESFERYSVILSRKPFGEEVVPPPPAAPVVPPSESVVNKVKMTAVVRDEAGVLRVGIVDLKSNRNYFLGIGDSLEGMEIVEADYERERARLRRGVEDYWVSMYGGSNRFEAVGKEEPRAATGAEARGTKGEGRAAGADVQRLPTLSPRVASASSKGDRDQRMSYALRRLQREAARRRAEEAAADKGAAEAVGTNALAGVVRSGHAAQTSKAGQDAEVARVLQSLTNQVELSEAEVAQLLQEYQKVLIRSGQTPLPIPLTPETDAQLVEEGVLPPQ